MEITSPLIITPRLQAGLQIGNSSFISIDAKRRDAHGRTCYAVWIDTPQGSHEITDLKSGCGGGDMRQGLASLLSFLSAAVESKRYRERTGMEGENEDLFAPAVLVWAEEHIDELDMLRYEIEGE